MTPPPSNNIVDLRSDTVTRPTPGMRQAMAEAEVGDDAVHEDPTVNALEKRVAELFEKEAAMFVPSGTMANLVSMVSQTNPGDSIIMSEDAHPFRFEAANVARVGGLLVRTVPAPDGILTADLVAPRIVRSDDAHLSETTLLAIENTTNIGGGQIYPVEAIESLAALVHENGMKLHCDGARVFNAVAATGTSPAEFAQSCDTVSFCFSKGLGAPVGSMVVCDEETYVKAYKLRKMLGGGMRQAGILAAAGIYALDRHVDRLREDHDRAARFREALEDTDGLSFPLPSPTNIVFLETAHAAEFAAKLRERDVLVYTFGPHRIRAVFHLDVDDNHLDRAIDAFQSVARAVTV